MTKSAENLTWKHVVAEALRQLGGEGHLSDINAIVEGHPKTATNPTWRDTIRRVVRQYSLFEPVPPQRSGVYRLVEAQMPRAEPDSLDSEEELINHGVAQGMLVMLGATYGYDTFVPKTDQTQRQFQGTQLSELVTVRDCTSVFPSRNVAQIREIDVLWFSEDEEGLYPVYAFEVEHSTRVSSGLDRLLKIPRRYPTSLFVLGPAEEEKALFDRRLAQEPFRTHRHRFRFRLYSELERLYNSAIEHDECRDAFEVVERWRQAAL